MPRTARCARLAAFAAAFLAPSVAFAAWAPGGVPLATANFSYGHSVVADGYGGVLTYWHGFDGTGGLFASRVLADGTPSAGLPLSGSRVGTPTFMTPFTGAARVGPDVFLAAWNPFISSTNGSLQMFRLHADGTLAPGWPDSGRRILDSDRPLIPRLAPDGADGLLIAWFARRPAPLTLPVTSVFDLYALRISGTGAVSPGWPAGGVAISEPPAGTAPVYTATALELASDGAGGMFVAWQDSSDGVGDLHLQHLDASGGIAAGWAPGGRTVCSFGSRKHQLNLAADGAGGVYVAWSEHRGAGYPVFLTRVTGAGATAAGWPPEGLQVTAPGVLATLGRIVADGVGGVILGSLEYRDGAQCDVYARRYLPDGTLAPGWSGGALVAAGASGDDLAGLMADGAGGAYFLVGGASGASSSHDGLALIGLDHAGAPALGLPAGGLPITSAPVSEAQLLPAEPMGGIVTWREIAFPIDLRGYKFVLSAPTATLASLVSASAEAGRARLEWSLSDAGAARVTIERRAPGDAWREAGHADVRPDGRVVFEDTAAPSGLVGYRIALESSAGTLRIGEVEVLVPAAGGLALVALPNPAPGGRLALRFAVPVAGTAMLEVLDVGGRVVRRESLDLAAGTHAWRLEAPLHAGVYFVRLSLGARSIGCRAVVMD